MSQILTITLNPALDVATAVDAVVPGAKLRCDAPRYDPGGGGVNVSRAVLRLGGQSQAFVAFGGETGLMALSMLKAEGIEPIHFPVPGNTRQSMAVVETSTGKQYRFQLPGPEWPPEQTAALLSALAPHLTPGRLVVMSGEPAHRRSRRYRRHDQPDDARQGRKPDPRHLGRCAGQRRRKHRPALRATQDGRCGGDRSLRPRLRIPPPNSPTTGTS